MWKNKLININCQDPGAAEIISHFIKAKKISKYTTNLGEISKKIFKKNSVKIKYKLPKKNLKKNSIFITGTSWRNKIELKLINEIKKNTKNKIITILDDRVNLKKRFFYKKKYLFPHEIWVPDTIKLSRKDLIFLKSCKIKNIKNYYLFSKKKEISKKKNFTNYKKNFIFLSQPIRKISKRFNINNKNDEYFYINKLLAVLHKLFLKKKLKLITIRLHPFEEKNKYLKILKKFHYLPIEISKNNLVTDIKKHKFTFGINTNAMTVATLNRNIVVSMLSMSKFNNLNRKIKILTFQKFKKMYL
tara:strand:+ start:994 stop:1899 length:906 start_codon:yes stop_codon:yes gene_type:complete